MLQDWYYAPADIAARRGRRLRTACRTTSSACGLTADWSGCCEDGHGVEIQLDKHNRPTVERRQIVLRDPTGQIKGSVLTDPVTGIMPAGTCMWCMATYDGSAPARTNGPYYEPFDFGLCCQDPAAVRPAAVAPRVPARPVRPANRRAVPPAVHRPANHPARARANPRPRKARPAKARPATARPARREQPARARANPRPPESPTSESPTSESPPANRPTIESPTSESPPSGESSSKSTAIVPASWSPTGYVALYVEESDEVRFNFVAHATLTEKLTRLPVDPKLLEVCAAGTFDVWVSTEMPYALGCLVRDGQLTIRQSRKRTIDVTIRLSAIRKGFSGQRFAARTKEQFESNERFIRSAYNR